MLRNRFCAFICLAAAIVTTSPLARADSSVSIVQSGFSPTDLELGSPATDQLMAYVLDGDGGVEAPNDQTTYAWSVAGVKCDPNYGSNYQTVTTGFTDSISDPTSQTATLHVTVDQPGNWMFIVQVTVTYSDGYAVHIFYDVPARGPLHLPSVDEVNGPRILAEGVVRTERRLEGSLPC